MSAVEEEDGRKTGGNYKETDARGWTIDCNDQSKERRNKQTSEGEVCGS